MARLLIVDDKLSIREMLEIHLSGKGYEVEVAADGPSAIRAFEERGHDVVITDLMLGRLSGLDVLRAVKAKSPTTEVIVMTAYSTQEGRIEAMKLGAGNYIPKIVPFPWEDLEQYVAKAIEKRSLAEDNQILRGRLSGMEGIVGRGPAMQAVFTLIDKVAPSRTTVLITGESGTGKELVARALHLRGPRAKEAFVPVNCGAIPEGLIETELFGHVKGAFTGAQGAKDGLFTAAHGGTLFLDEVAELPVGLQVKLLRVLQERRIRAVGATEDQEVDVRLIAATNRELPEEVRAGRFREDLYYRLNVVQVRVPPLRDRREDVFLLAEHFLRRLGAEHGRGRLTLSREAKRRLDEYAFPGNVRELENLIERAVALADGPEVTLDALPSPLRAQIASGPGLDGPLPPGFSLEEHLAQLERSFIDRALTQASFVKKNAAALLGLTFRQLRHRIKKLEGEPITTEDEAADEAEPTG